jgi:hypothetical protein
MNLDGGLAAPSHHLAAPTPPSGADGNITGLNLAGSSLVPFSRFSRRCVSTIRLRRLSLRRLCATIPQLQR